MVDCKSLSQLVPRKPRKRGRIVARSRTYLTKIVFIFSYCLVIADNLCIYENVFPRMCRMHIMHKII